MPMIMAMIMTIMIFCGSQEQEKVLKLTLTTLFSDTNWKTRQKLLKDICCISIVQEYLAFVAIFAFCSVEENFSREIWKFPLSQTKAGRQRPSFLSWSSQSWLLTLTWSTSSWSSSTLTIMINSMSQFNGRGHLSYPDHHNHVNHIIKHDQNLHDYHHYWLAPSWSTTWAKPMLVGKVLKLYEKSVSCKKSDKNWRLLLRPSTWNICFEKIGTISKEKLLPLFISCSFTTSCHCNRLARKQIVHLCTCAIMCNCAIMQILHAIL